MTDPYPRLFPSEGLVAALARSQAKFPAIVKSQTAKVKSERTGKEFEYSYADLAVILAVVRPVLAAEGIVISQATDVDAETGAVVLVTTLMHGSEMIASRFPLHIAGLNAQGVGSLMTYQRRYQLCAILGVHPEGDDDDGQQAQAAPARGAPRDAATVVPPPDDWETQPLARLTFAELRAIADHLGHPFSGGSKAELIRQLEPLIRARSGEEPFPLEGAEPIPAKPDDHDKPFAPKVHE